MEIRCDHKKHAELVPETETLEIKCQSRFCGAAPGVVVIHEFNTRTGEHVRTRSFKDPRRNL